MYPFWGGFAGNQKATPILEAQTATPIFTLNEDIGGMGKYNILENDKHWTGENGPGLVQASSVSDGSTSWS